ncbi:hypothetical protein CHU98_g4329 [Xylaria longipes]|nr:hypothetical protein CHU98_g4329 [Xylaria longipes]
MEIFLPTYFYIYTPLRAIAGVVSLDWVRILIQRAYRGGATELQAAACFGDFEVVLLLLDNGADTNVPTSAPSNVILYGYPLPSLEIVSVKASGAL